MRPLELFRANIRRIHAIHALHAYLNGTTTVAVNTDDLLRTEIVLLVSALDHYVHEITRTFMIEAAEGRRLPTDAFNRFTISLKVALEFSDSRRVNLLDAEIRERHGYLSFQKADAIADAIRNISNIELWNAVSHRLSADPKALKRELNLIISRRNQIAHEADLDPSYPGTMWPIDSVLVEAATVTIVRVVEAIDTVI